MDTIFMNSKNSKTSDPHRLLLNLTDKLNFEKGDKYVVLSNLSIYYTWKNIKNSYKNNKLKISAPTRNEEFELIEGSYSVSDIQDYFKYILKKHERVTDNPSLKIYVNKMENRITLHIKTGYYLEFLPLETMKLFGSYKSKITKDESSKNMHHLEIIEVVSVHCNIVNNDYQQDSKVLHTLLANISFGQLLDILTPFYIFKNF